MRKVSMLYGIMEVMITQRIANMTYLALLRTVVVDCTAVRSRAGNLYKFSVRFTVGTNLITSEAPELGRIMKSYSNYDVRVLATEGLPKHDILPSLKIAHAKKPSTDTCVYRPGICCCKFVIIFFPQQ